MQLTGRTILITGGTSGIGFELAKQLLERGNTILITGRDQNKLDTTKVKLLGSHTFRSDAGRPEQVQALRAHILGEFLRATRSSNNAGIMRNLNLKESRTLTDLTREVDTI